MTKFTKEQLQQIVETDHVQCGDAAAMARQMLAWMEQEPVAHIFKHPAGKLFWSLTDESNATQSDVFPVYAAPQLQQPAVPEDIARRIPEILRTGKANRWEIQALAKACRAAMLQGAEPVSQPDELPLDYLQGHKDGLEWAARMAEANHPQTGDWLYDDPLELAKAIRKGPDMPTAPVQGWIPCSERMPEGMVDVITSNGVDIGKGWWDGDDWKEWNKHDAVPGKVTHWQPMPAAPQQEVK